MTGAKPCKAEMLVLAYYNGSKLKEFTFMVDKTRETRKQRKLVHQLNFKFKIAQVVPIRTRVGVHNYLVRDEFSNELNLIKSGSSDKKRSTKNPLDCSSVVGLVG